VDEFDVSLLEGIERLGIIGGASTPISIVEEARRRIMTLTA
jgi:4-hydroxy-3-methylbut-2-enyl diphosphate reductase IspH